MNPGHIAVEMTADPLFARRVVRLALTSVVALGLIWLLWSRTVAPRPFIGSGLGAGWVLMPSLLVLSLKWPKIRYALVLPSSLVGGALLAVCVWALPDAPVTAAGWLLMTGGVLFGGLLGIWFWFRWLPVPAALSDPFAPGRWRLIGVHVFLIVLGLVLVSLGAFS